MQQMIVQSKHDQLSELVGSKQAKISVLKAKNAELEEQKKRNDHKIKVDQNDLNTKEKRFQHKLNELDAMQA